MKSLEDGEPVLRDLVRRMDGADPAEREKLTAAALGCFDELRGTVPYQELRELLRRLRAESADGTPGAEFLDNASKAFELLLEDAFKKIIRNVTKSYRTDGTTARCPKCGSTSVREGFGIYEFSEMTCDACGLHEYLDDFQLETWYPEAATDHTDSTDFPNPA